MTNRKTLRDAMMFAFGCGREYDRRIGGNPDRRANIDQRLMDSVEYWAKQLDDSKQDE
jgi:hypothetical protein